MPLGAPSYAPGPGVVGRPIQRDAEPARAPRLHRDQPTRAPYYIEFGDLDRDRQEASNAVPLHLDAIGIEKELLRLDIDKELVPLTIERNKYANQYGENHPTVKKLDAELNRVKSELRKSAREQADRMLLLRQKQTRSELEAANDNKEDVLESPKPSSPNNPLVEQNEL